MNLQINKETVGIIRKIGIFIIGIIFLLLIAKEKPSSQISYYYPNYLPSDMAEVKLETDVVNGEELGIGIRTAFTTQSNERTMIITTYDTPPSDLKAYCTNLESVEEPKNIGIDSNEDIWKFSVALEEKVHYSYYLTKENHLVLIVDSNANIESEEIIKVVHSLILKNK